MSELLSSTLLLLLLQAKPGIRWISAGSSVVEGTRGVARGVLMGSVIVAARLRPSPCTQEEEGPSTESCLAWETIASWSIACWFLEQDPENVYTPSLWRHCFPLFWALRSSPSIPSPGPALSEGLKCSGPMIPGTALLILQESKRLVLSCRWGT